MLSIFFQRRQEGGGVIPIKVPHVGAKAFRNVIHYPTNIATLINFRPSSDAEILLVSTDWANVQKHVRNVYIFWLSFYFA